MPERRKEDLRDRTTRDRRTGDRYTGKTNLPDYGVPSGVQLTENLKEEIVEAVRQETPETPPEK